MPKGVHTAKCKRCRFPVTSPCNCKSAKGEHTVKCASILERCVCAPNPLDSEDFARIHIPYILWGVTLEGVSESSRVAVGKFSERIKEVKDKGVSLYIYGPKGCGKSGAATVIMKEARAWGFTAYGVSVTELRESVRTHAPFDTESTVMDRCRLVDFLLLDDLRVEDAAEKMFTINDIRNLIVSRYDRGLPTLITSVLKSMEWGTAPANAPGIRDAIEKCCAVLQVDGPNRHKVAQELKNKFLE